MWPLRSRIWRWWTPRCSASWAGVQVACILAARSRISWGVGSGDLGNGILVVRWCRVVGDVLLEFFYLLYQRAFWADLAVLLRVLPSGQHLATPEAGPAFGRWVSQWSVAEL